MRLYLYFVILTIVMGCVSVPIKHQKSVMLIMSPDLQEALIPETTFEGVLLSDFIDSTVELTDTYRGGPNPSATMKMTEDTILIYFNQGENIVLGDGVRQYSVKDIEKELPINIRLYGHCPWLTLRELILRLNDNDECKKHGIQLSVKSFSKENVW